MAETRKLAAILCSEVVAYSRRAWRGRGSHPGGCGRFAVT
jgi:hypothetical protein